MAEMTQLALDSFGFRWGPLKVTRYFMRPDGSVVLGLVTDANVALQVHVSPTGRKVRIFEPQRRAEWRRP